MVELIKELFPICRSITGNGVRATLDILARYIPLKKHEIPSGTRVADWTIPPEWNITDAWIKNRSGHRIIDFNASNLHVVGYSKPIHDWISLEELKSHLFSLPEYPDWIPYRTSFYTDNWGFCLTHNQLQSLYDPEYEVCIKSSLKPGHLTYGEFYLSGECTDEVLVSCHVCHPSLCNDNLSGIAVSVFLAKFLQEQRCRHSYRFLYIPATIGAISWLALNQEACTHIRHGLTLACLGDENKITYKKTFHGDSEIDRVAAYVLEHSGKEYEIAEFFPFGYDERQYNSPGYRLAVGSLMRGRHGLFPQYHTSADNLDYIKTAQLEESLNISKTIFVLLDNNRSYINLSPYGEPQLTKHGLHRPIASEVDPTTFEHAMLWVLNLSDGQHSLLDIAERSRISFSIVRQAAERLQRRNLLKETTIKPPVEQTTR